MPAHGLQGHIARPRCSTNQPAADWHCSRCMQTAAHCPYTALKCPPLPQYGALRRHVQLTLAGDRRVFPRRRTRGATCGT